MAGFGRCAFNVQRSTFNVWRLAFGVWRLAGEGDAFWFGVLRGWLSEGFGLLGEMLARGGFQEGKAGRIAYAEENWLTGWWRFHMIGHVTVHVNGSDSLPGPPREDPLRIYESSSIAFL
jgi:hypothetical protein